MTATRDFVLLSAGLLSKWGFEDGDVLGNTYPDFDFHDEHAVLVALVQRYLVPALAQVVEVQEIGTIHNPIRAWTVDGVSVTDEWYAIDHTTTLIPTTVTIPFATVRAVAVELAQRTEPPKETA